MRELDSLRAALDGELITPDSAGYDAARRPALARFHDVRPAAVVSCASTRDMKRMLAFARHSGVHVAPCASPSAAPRCAPPSPPSPSSSAWPSAWPSNPRSAIRS